MISVSAGPSERRAIAGSNTRRISSEVNGGIICRLGINRYGYGIRSTRTNGVIASNSISFRSEKWAGALRIVYVLTA